MKPSYLFSTLILSLLATNVAAEEIGCATTTWKLIGANNKVCVQAFDDPKVEGVACYISQARTGGIAGTLGVAEDPSQFSLSCNQIGPILIKSELPKEETAFKEDTSLFFKETKVKRLFDAKRKTLVYVAISRKVIEGAHDSSISTVPIMPWNGH